MTAHIVEFESFTEAELETLEFFPEELESIQAELYPNLESISPQTVAKDLEAYFEGDVEEVGLEGRGGRGGGRAGGRGRSPSRSPSRGRGRSPSRSPSRGRGRSPSRSPSRGRGDKTKGQKITVCGYEFEQTDFHRILKPKIIAYLKQKNVDIKAAGSNPDITCKQGKVVLVGQQRGKKQVETDFQFATILQELGFMK